MTVLDSAYHSKGHSAEGRAVYCQKQKSREGSIVSETTREAIEIHRNYKGGQCNY